jgi:acetyl esterase/lipase
MKSPSSLARSRLFAPFRLSALLATFCSVSFTALMSAAEPTTIPLWPEGVPNLRADATEEKSTDNRTSNIHHPSLTVYPAPAGKANGTAVIVCPGGGYVRLAMDKEGTEYAQWLNTRGITAFVLKYRMVEYGQPAPLQDALRAIRLIRSRAAEFGVKPDRIGIMGSSAGGHLSSSAATLFDAPEGKTGNALDSVSARPDFAILCYPVITMTEPNTHAGSRKSLLGENPSPDLIARWSTENQVTSTTPPTFIFHTTEDGAVPVENALAFYAALKRNKVPAELHVFEKGGHGVGMRAGNGPTSDWPELLEAWLRLHGWIAK